MKKIIGIVLALLIVAMVSGCVKQQITPSGNSQTGVTCSYNHDCGTCDVCVNSRCVADECYTGTSQACCVPGKCVCTTGQPAFIDGRYCGCV